MRKDNRCHESLICKAHAMMLKESMTPADVKALRKDLQGMPEREWYGWCRDHKAEIFAFVSSATAGNLPASFSEDPKLRRRLLLATHRHLIQGAVLLDALHLHKPTLDLEASVLAARAGEAYWEILETRVPWWPFEPPSPFAED